MNNIEILAQFFGIVAIIIWNLSIQNKELKRILFFQFIANLFYSLEYFLLGAGTAGLMDFTSGCRCFVFYYKNKKNKPISKKWLFIFCFLITVLGIIGYNGPISLIPVILTLFYTISSYTKTSNWTRISFLLAAFIWIYYNIQVKAYVGVIGNSIEIISGIISIFRFRNISEQT